MTTTTDYFVSYQIQLRDAFANWRTMGGDSLVAAISNGPISDVTALQVSDNNNGSFTVLNQLTRSGDYTVSLGLDSFENENALPFSPVFITVIAGAPTATVSRAYGASLRKGVAGTLEIFGTSIFDKYANPCRVGGLNLVVILYRVDGGSHLPVDRAAIIHANGTYSGEYYQTCSGQYVLSVLVMGEPIFSSPFSLFIDAAEVTSQDSTAFQTRDDHLQISVQLPGTGVVNVLRLLRETDGIVGGVSAQQFDIMIRARDRFGNAANRAGIIFNVTTNPSYPTELPSNKGQGNLFTTFTPTAAGSLTINIKYNGLHIKSSPFSVQINTELGVTSGTHCFALGDGTCIGTAGADGVFLVQAVDQFSRYKTSGGDSFSVQMTMPSTFGVNSIIDRGTGSYVVISSTTVSGIYSLGVLLADSHIRGSPYSVRIWPAQISPLHCTVHGFAVGTAGEPRTFEIRARDRFSNVQIYSPINGRDLFNVKMLGPVGYESQISDLLNSSYIVRYELTVSGIYSVSVTTRLSSDLVGGRLLSLNLVSNRVDPRSSVVYGAGLQFAIAGTRTKIFANLRDMYGNVAKGAIATIRAFANESSLDVEGEPVSDGTLSLTYNVTKSAMYILSVQAFQSISVSSLLNLDGSPFTVVVSSSDPFPGSPIVLLPIISTTRFGEVFRFGIDSYDRYGNVVRTGGALVSAEVMLLSVTRKSQTLDNQNGSYWCAFDNLNLGIYQLEVRMQGILIGNASQCVDADQAACASRGTCAELNLIMFAPSTACCKCEGGTWRPPLRNVSIVPGPLNVSTSYIVSRTSLIGTTGQVSSIKIACRDRYFNPTFYSDLPVLAQMEGASGRTVLREVGTELIISWNVTMAGSYRLLLTMGDLNIAVSPFVIDVRPGLLQPLKSSFSGIGLSVSTAGVVSNFMIVTKDTYSNIVRLSPFESSPPFSFEIRSGNDVYQADVVGMHNDSMLVSYEITRSGQYRMDVYFGLRNLSVYAYTPLKVHTNAIDVSNVIMTFLPTSVVAGTSILLVVAVQDVYGNKISHGGAKFSIIDTIQVSQRVYQMVDWTNGTYSYDLLCTKAGDHYVNVLLGSQRVTKDSSRVRVDPQATPSSQKSFAFGPGTVGGVRGSALTIDLFFRDSYDNDMPASTSAVLSMEVQYAAGGQTLPLLLPNGASSYKIFQYVATKSGKATLSILLSGISLIGSPYDLQFGTEQELSNTPGYGVLSAKRSYIRNLTPDHSVITAGSVSTLLIQAVDQIGFEMTTGGTGCVVTAISEEMSLTFSGTDTNDGRYLATLSDLTICGKYVIAVTLGGENTSGKPPQPNSSYIVDVLPGEISRQHSLVQNHLAPGTAGTDGTFTIEVRDAYANLNASAGAALISLIGPATENSLHVVDNSNGTWIISYRVTVSGQYEIGCKVGSVQFQPAYLSILPGPVSATSTVSEGNGLSRAFAGEQAELRVLVRDVFGNSQKSAGVHVYTSPRNTTFAKSVLFILDGEQVIFTYLPTVSGDYKFFIMVGNTAIRTTPWTVDVSAGEVDAVKCQVDGKGSREATAGDLASFVISARDLYSNPLTYGGFTFVVHTKEEIATRRHSCADMGTGKYDCRYTTTISGKLMLSIMMSFVHVTGSPFNIPVKPSLFNAGNAIIREPSMGMATAGRYGVLVMTARDRLGNFLDTGWDNFIISIENGGQSRATSHVTDYKNGTYSIRYISTTSGRYTINIIYQGTPVANSPYGLSVVAAEASALTSKITFPAGYSCVESIGMCGRVAQKFPILLNLQDIYGNLLFTPAQASVKVAHGGITSDLFEGIVQNGRVSLKLVGTHSGAYRVSVTVNLQAMNDIQVQLSPLFFSENGCFAAEGNGLFVATAGRESQFMISTRDVFGNKVKTMLLPTINIRARNDLQEEVSIKYQSRTRVFGSEWEVYLQVNISGTMYVELEVMNTFVAGVPFRVAVQPSTLSEAVSIAEGPGIQASVHSRETWFRIKPRDRYSNDVQILDATVFDVLVLHQDGSPQYPTVGYDLSGWTGKYSPISVGSATYRLTVKINSIEISGSPFTVKMRNSISKTVSAIQSFASGTATRLSTAGVISVFTIQAADDYGVYQTHGNTEFSVEMVIEEEFIRIDPQDNSDGTYTLQYRVTMAGQYVLAVILGQNHISGSPFKVLIMPAMTSARDSRFVGEGLTRSLAGQEGSFTVEARDRFGNIQLYRPSSSLPYDIVISGPTTKIASMKDFRDSSFVAVYNITVSGTYSVDIKAGASDPAKRSLVVAPTLHWPGTSYIDPAMLRVTAGGNYLVKVSIRDLYNNTIVAPTTDLVLTSIRCTVAGVGPLPILAKDGNFMITMNLTFSGRYQLALTVASSLTSTSPYHLVILAGKFSAASTTVSGPGLVDNVVERASSLMLRPSDALGNALEIDVRDVAVSLLGLDTNLQVSISQSQDAISISYSEPMPCQACNLSIRVRGQHVNGSPFKIFINPAEAPRLQTATFASHFAGLTVTFDRPTDEGGGQLAGFFDCMNVLELNSYRMSGNNSQCSWISSRSFSLLFGKDATMVPDSRLAIKENTIMAARRNSRFSSGTVPLLLPANAMTPEPIIDGPGRIASCDVLTLDASSTYGDGGRDMLFHWGLELGPRNRALLMSILTSLPSTQRVVTIPNSTLLPGVSYAFSLTVKNFVEMQKTASKTLFVGSANTPQVLVVGQAERLMRGSNAIELRGRSALSKCAPAADNVLNFVWTQISGAVIPWPAESTRTSSSLYLPKNTLVAGQQYTLRLSAQLKNDQTGFSFADISIEVVNSPVFAVLDGGDRTHSASLDLKMDAANSIDSDASSQPFVFDWSCSPHPCFNDVSGVLSSTDSEITIPGGSLVPGEYVFAVMVSKDPGPRTSQASVQISVKQGTISSVSVTLNGVGQAKVSVGDRLVLTGQVEFGSQSRSIACNPSYAWSIVAGDVDLNDPNKTSTNLVSPNLVLMGDALVRGQTYVIELSGACQFEIAGWSRLTIQVDQGPVGGSFSSMPKYGTALKTTFSLECSQWIDELENLPLTYVYQAALWNQIKPLSGQIASNKLHLLLSPPTKPGYDNETVGLNAIVCNTFASCTASAVVNVLNKNDQRPPSAKELSGLISDAEGVGNTEMIVGASGAIFNQLNVDARRRAGRRIDRRQDVELRKELIQALSLVSMTVVTQESVSFVSTALQPAMDTKDLIFQDVHQTGLDIVQRLLQTSVQAEQVSDSASQNLGKTLSGIVQAVSLQGLPRRSAGGVDVYDRVHSLMTTLGHVRMLGRVPYEAPVMIQTPNLEHHAGRFSQEQLQKRTVLASTKCLSGVCNSVILPQASPGGLSIVDAQLLVWSTERRPAERELILTNITSVQLLNGAVVLSGELQSPLQISIPVRASAVNEKESGEYVVPVCQFWDADKNAWNGAGCIAVGKLGDSLECACFHTTDFAGLFRPALFDLGRSDLFLTSVDVLYGREPDKMFVIVSVSVACFLAIVLVVYGYFYDVDVSKSYTPSLRATLFQRGYLHAATKRLEQRFRSLFLDLWARRTSHLLQTRHGIVGIFFRQPKDPYDRASRIACVTVHVVTCMCLNIIWLGAIGMPDGDMLAIGIFTGLILIPVLPMCAVVFKTVAPAPRDRRKKSRKKAQVKAQVRSKKSDISSLRIASRRSRVEVAGTVEAVDNPGTGHEERGPGPAIEPRPTTAIPPTRNIDYGQLQEAVPRTREQRGPRTPEVTRTMLIQMCTKFPCVSVDLVYAILLLIVS